MNRLQLKRTKGWRKPASAITVTRPSRWGNPFRLQGDEIYVDAEHRRKLLCKWVPMGHGTAQQVVELYRGLFLWTDAQAGEYLVKHGLDNATTDFFWWKDFFSRQDITELSGRDLACWCPEHSPCHANVLLELANEPDRLKLVDLNCQTAQIQAS